MRKALMHLDSPVDAGVILGVYLFFVPDTATTEIYTLSLHDALPILRRPGKSRGFVSGGLDLTLLYGPVTIVTHPYFEDRKSTRLNSSHRTISYAVFCLQKKKDSWIWSSCSLGRPCGLYNTKLPFRVD